MQKIEKLLQKRAAELLAEGTVERVLAWQAGEFFYDNAPAAVGSADECDKLVYNEFCPANLCKYLIETSHAGKKTAVFLKPCDTYGVNQLLKDNRIKRELVYAIGTPCSGMLDINKINLISQLADKHHFKMAGFRNFERAVSHEKIEEVKHNAQLALAVHGC